MIDTRTAPYAALLLRLALGGMFLAHGLLKIMVFTPAGTVGFFASLGLPGLCGFIGEVWVLLGTFNAGTKYWWAYPMAIIAASGVILTAGYILWLVRRVYLGTGREEYKGYSDTSWREMGILQHYLIGHQIT